MDLQLTHGVFNVLISTGKQYPREYLAIYEINYLNYNKWSLPLAQYFICFKHLTNSAENYHWKKADNKLTNTYCMRGVNITLEIIALARGLTWAHMTMILHMHIALVSRDLSK